jgi:hypothetical protein
MSKQQRDSLIDHANGPQPIVIGPDSATRSSLIARGLLRYETHNRWKSPTHRTVLTEFGREVLCMVLGDYADALVRTNCLAEMPEIALMRPRPERTAICGTETEQALLEAWRGERAISKILTRTAYGPFHAGPNTQKAAPKI